MNGSAPAPVPAPVVLAAPSRRRLLELVRAAAAPPDAYELASAVGLHVTTVRFHLDVLRRAGLVTTRSRPGPSVGRPRMVYVPVTHAEPAGYPALAGLLAAHLADTPAARAARAEQAGSDWADDIFRTVPADGYDPERAARAITGLFAELGFDPDPAGDHAAWQIRLRDCPFRTVARAHPEVVCSVHLGLLRGTLARLGGRPAAASLQPFVAPDLCLAYLAAAPAPGDGDDSGG